jgi:AraC-like DNA-binding protein
MTDDRALSQDGRVASTKLIRPPVPTAASPRRRIVLRRNAGLDRFHAMVAARLADPPPIPKLCAELGVPPRTLRTWCQDSFGMSPKRYIHVVRMTCARDTLRHTTREETSVTAIASALGFGNLGRFAVEYRALFGESPSATLRAGGTSPRQLPRERAAACAEVGVGAETGVQDVLMR